LWILLEKVIVLKNSERRWGLLPLVGYPWHVAYRYNNKSYVIRLKTDNWRYAAQLSAEG